MWQAPHCQVPQDRDQGTAVIVWSVTGISPGGAAVGSQGRQPLDSEHRDASAPEGRQCRGDCRPSGAEHIVRIRFQGLTPLATNCRPSGAEPERRPHRSRRIRYDPATRCLLHGFPSGTLRPASPAPQTPGAARAAVVRLPALPLRLQHQAPRTVPGPPTSGPRLSRILRRHPSATRAGASARPAAWPTTSTYSPGLSRENGGRRGAAAAEVERLRNGSTTRSRAGGVRVAGRLRGVHRGATRRSTRSRPTSPGRRNTTRTQTFEDEFLALLRRHDIEFDEHYLWD